MDLRIFYSAVLTILALVLAVCGTKALRSHKRFGKTVGLLELALLPPMIGNIIIIGSSVWLRSLIGYYIYFLGMDLVMFALVNFTNEYCRGIGDGQRKPTFVYIIIIADAVQMLLNPFFGHAFSLEPVEVQDKAYYRIVVHFGQNIHRLVDYIVFVCVLLIFILGAVKTTKIFRERFTVVLAAMMIVGFWQSFYIFSRTPIDRSMIGYGIFGIIVFYLSLYHRPLRLLDRLLSNIVSEMPDALFVYDPLGRCIWANEKGLQLAHVKVNELEKVPGALRGIFGKRKYIIDEWEDERVIGFGEEARYFFIENHSVNDENKRFVGSYLVVRDTTEEQQKLKKEFYASTHDTLTGLYTKQYLYECIRKLLGSDPDTDFYAVFVDVKNFKIVNDVFSSDFGDHALIQIAEWIKKNMSISCVYGRLAGDTFGIFMPKERFEKDKEKTEKKLSNFVVASENFEHRLLIHIGVYEVVNRDMDVSVMFDRAHLALSTITDEYNMHIAYYDNDLREKMLWDQRISAALTLAIRTRQIRPYLQPITDNRGRVVGAEALARWQHPDYGFMPPVKFIPVFEKNGMIVELDRYMWRCACEILRDWKGKHDDLFVSVNISPKDFYFFDVASEIKGLVREFDIDPSKLRIEITETVMMNDSEERMKILDELRQSGFVVEMDDFGSGYSSLNMLKDMPVDVLKIDMKFLSSSKSRERAKTIVKNIIKLSEELDIDSLTEGVETRYQYQQLSQMGCKMFQGYYFAKPMPIEDFVSFAVKKNS